MRVGVAQMLQREQAAGQLLEYEIDDVTGQAFVSMMRWVKVGEPTPLLRRQELERTEPHAFVTVAELQRSHARFVHNARGAVRTTSTLSTASETVSSRQFSTLSKSMLAERADEALLVSKDDREYLPIISVSHCVCATDAPAPPRV
jgi:hypothetical protein